MFFSSSSYSSSSLASRLSSFVLLMFWCLDGWMADLNYRKMVQTLGSSKSTPVQRCDQKWMAFFFRIEDERIAGYLKLCSGSLSVAQVNCQHEWPRNGEVHRRGLGEWTNKLGFVFKAAISYYQVCRYSQWRDFSHSTTMQNRRCSAWACLCLYIEWVKSI